MPLAIEDLLAREEIRQCVLRHFRAADRADLALERSALWPDARFIGGPVDGTADEFSGPLIAMLPDLFDTLIHYITNLLVTVTGSRGLVEAYGFAYHLIRDDPEALGAVLGEAKLAELAPQAGQRIEMTIGVRYAIEMQRRGEEWRILTMQPIIEWTRVQPWSGIAEGGLVAAMPTPSLRSPTDASYFGGEFRP